MKNISISVKGVEMKESEELKIREKVGHLKTFDPSLEGPAAKFFVEIHKDETKDSHDSLECKISIVASHVTFHASSRGGSLLETVDLTCPKLSIQIKKRREKQKG